MQRTRLMLSCIPFIVLKIIQIFSDTDTHVTQFTIVFSLVCIDWAHVETFYLGSEGASLTATTTMCRTPTTPPSKTLRRT